jgi:hypothetical protein
LTSFLISVVLQCCCAAIPYAPLADLLFVLWTVAYLPAVSFFYARKLRYGGKHSVPYTLAHSFLLALSFLIFFQTREGMATALVLFAWCELWALFGLIRKQKIPCF